LSDTIDHATDWRDDHERFAVVETDAGSAEPTTEERPKLLLFYSETSGKSRRVEGFLAQVLQRRRNHDTFELVRISVERRPDLAERFCVSATPTFLVVADRRIQRRILSPRGCRDLQAQLQPWLR